MSHAIRSRFARQRGACWLEDDRPKPAGTRQRTTPRRNGPSGAWRTDDMLLQRDHVNQEHVHRIPWKKFPLKIFMEVAVGKTHGYTMESHGALHIFMVRYMELRAGP